MKKNFLIGLSVIIGFLAVIVLLVWGIAGWIKSVDAGVAAAIITAIAGILGLLYSQWHNKAKEISEGHRPKKIELYNTFFDIVDHYTRNERENKIEDGIPKTIQKQFEKLNRGLIVWASPGVIKAWLNFRRGAEDPNQNTLILVDALLKEIRKDLGNSNWNLQDGDIVRIYLKDVDDLDTSKIKSNQSVFTTP